MNVYFAQTLYSQLSWFSPTAELHLANSPSQWQKPLANIIVNTKSARPSPRSGQLAQAPRAASMTTHNIMPMSERRSTSTGTTAAQPRLIVAAVSCSSYGCCSSSHLVQAHLILLALTAASIASTQPPMSSASAILLLLPLLLPTPSTSAGAGVLAVVAPCDRGRGCCCFSSR